MSIYIAHRRKNSASNPLYCVLYVVVCCWLKLSGVQDKAASEGFKVLTPLISLDTPSKVTVQVVILADPVSIVSFTSVSSRW